jgi:hypothetical protein
MVVWESASCGSQRDMLALCDKVPLLLLLLLKRDEVMRSCPRHTALDHFFYGLGRYRCPPKITPPSRRVFG